MARHTIDFDLDGLAHVLSEIDLRVPKYQRSYAWQDEQVREYWSDLKHALDEGYSEYFMGTIVLAEDDGGAVIIDGQQRLATTSILLATLRDAYSARGDTSRATGIHTGYIARFDLETATEVPRLRLNAEDDDFFRSAVVEGAPDAPSIDSHSRMLSAQEFLRRRVEEDLSAAAADWNRRIVSWVSFLDQRVKVMRIVVPDMADAFVIFETLNDRGLPLTISDLLRNYLMATARDDEGIEAVQDAWGEVLLQLGLQQEENIFVDFLRQFWSSHVGAVREKELYGSIRDAVTERDDALRFAQGLPDAARRYAALLDSQHELWSDYEPVARASVEALVRLELGQYRPLALAVLEHFERPEQVRTLRALVSWAVRGLLVGGVGGGVTERAYCTAALRVRAGDIANADDLLRQLLPIIPADDDFLGAFERARVSRPGVARYVMTALERQTRDMEQPELVDAAFATNVRLQYVLPKTASAEDWPTVDADEVKSMVTRIGNLVTLSDEDGELEGQTYEERRPVLAQSTVTLTRQVAEWDTWSSASVAERQQRLAARALEVWPRSPRR